MNEFKVTIKQPAVIIANFEDIKEGAAGIAAAYETIPVTEDNLQERKKDVATLRKIIKAVEDKRKETKREYEKPLKEFESQCKEITKILQAPIDRFNADLNQFEQKRIADKREAINRVYERNIGEYSDYLPLEALMRPQWLNKGYLQKDIAADIQTAVISVRQDINTIKAMCAPWVDECKLVYMANGNSLTSALQRYKDLQSAKEAAETRILGSRQQTPTDTPETQEKPATGQETASEWTFTVYTEDDAKFIRDTCEVLGIKFKEG